MNAAEHHPMESAEMLQPGDAVGRYQLLCPIARGGMGVVWAARQTGRLGLPGLVAIKIALRSGHRVQDYLFDEAKVAAAIDHPNVCRIFELGQEGESLFIAMEWIHGVSMAYLLKTLPKRRMDYGVAAQLLSQAAAGLHAAHELKDDEGQLLEVVHRDATPQNLLIAATGDLKVVDFGIVKAKNQIHQATETGELKGKLSYLAPEQVRGKTLDRRADVFSLGCVLYVATTGRSPFNDGDAASTITKLMNGEYPPPSALVEDYPDQLERILVRALASQPSDRYPSADALRVALEDFAASGPRPTTRDDVARLVNDRCGTSIEACRANIRAAQRLFDSQATSVRAQHPGVARTGRSGTYVALGREPPESRPKPELVPPPLPSTLPPPPSIPAAPPRIELSSDMRIESGSAPLSTEPSSLDARPGETGRFRRAAVALGLGMTALLTASLVRVPRPAPDQSAAKLAPAVIRETPPPAAEVRVKVVIDAEPDGAALSIDGGPPLATPYTSWERPDRRPHVLRLTASGREPVVERVFFDRDQSFLFELPRARSKDSAPSQARAFRRVPQRAAPAGVTAAASRDLPSATSASVPDAGTAGFPILLEPRAPWPIDERDPFRGAP
jgi:serine/threonine protein kinase